MGVPHKGSEAYLVGLFEDSNLAAIHAKWQTLMVQDMCLVHKICGDDLPQDGITTKEIQGSHSTGPMSTLRDKSGIWQGNIWQQKQRKSRGTKECS